MTTFKPFELDGIPMPAQMISWDELTQIPYERELVDAFTRARIVLMNSIEQSSVLTSHAMARMIDNEDINMAFAFIRRADSQHQHLVNMLQPADQSIIETSIANEQCVVELTADLAQHEPDDYSKQVLDFALLEDFDHLFRFSCLLALLEQQDAKSITQDKTESKPGRPCLNAHRHPFDEMRKHYEKKTASIKTKMNYHTIVAAEQQTMLYYKAHGCMLEDDLARKLFVEIAELEEQHLSQYELLGDPRETPLEKMALIQLNEAYNYFSCAATETDARIRAIWERLCEEEITHFLILEDLLKKYEKRNIIDIMRTDVIEPLITFQSNKDYINQVLQTQVTLQPVNKEFVSCDELPANWASFAYQQKVNAGMVPSEEVKKRVKCEG